QSAAGLLRDDPAGTARPLRACRPGHHHHGGAGHRLVRAGARPQHAAAACVRRGRRGGIHPPFQDALRTAAQGDLRMNPLLTLAITATLVLYVLAMLLALVRVLRGPRAQDRVLALDFM